MKVSLILSLFLCSSIALGKTYGLILSGGGDPDANHYRYYDNAVKMNQALISAGVSKENVSTLYADGNEIGNNTNMNPTSESNGLSVGLRQTESLRGQTRIDGGASKASVNKYFDDLAAKVKAGDKLVFYITDHGSKDQGVVLWNGESLSVEELQFQLSKLPQSVNVQIMTNMCYGGQLLKLTGPNVCVSANTDEETVSYSQALKDSYTVSATNALKKNPQLSFQDMIKAGVDGDHPRNTRHMTSLDYLIQKSESRDPRKQCDRGHHGLLDFVSQSSQVVQKAKVPTAEEEMRLKLVAEAAAKKEALAKKMQLLNAAPENQQAVKIKKAWDQMDPVQRELQRNTFVSAGEQFKNYMDQTDSLKAQTAQIEKEIQYLQRASSSEITQFANTKKCMETPVGEK